MALVLRRLAVEEGATIPVESMMPCRSAAPNLEVGLRRKSGFCGKWRFERRAWQGSGSCGFEGMTIWSHSHQPPKP